MTTVFYYVNLKINCCLNRISKCGGKLFIHCIKHRTDNHMQSLEIPVMISYLRIDILYDRGAWLHI